MILREDTVFHFDLQMFAEGDAGGGGATDGGTGGSGAAAGGAAAGTSQQQQQGAAQQQGHVEPAQPQSRNDRVGRMEIDTEYFNRVKKERDEAQAKNRKFEEEQAAAERKRLESQGEYQRVAEMAEKRARDAEERIAAKARAAEDRAVLAELKARAAAEGIIDLDDVRLIDRSSITVDENSGNYIGLDDLVSRFKQAKPHKFKSATAAVQAAADQTQQQGSGGGQGGTQQAAAGTQQQAGSQNQNAGNGNQQAGGGQQQQQATDHSGQRARFDPFTGRPIPTVTSNDSPGAKNAMEMDEPEFRALMHKTFGNRVNF